MWFRLKEVAPGSLIPNREGVAGHMGFDSLPTQRMCSVVSDSSLGLCFHRET